MAGEHAAPWSEYSVLVVDDEPGMLSFCSGPQFALQHVVDCAASVEAARRPLIQRNLYDLVVLDIAGLFRHRLAARVAP